MSIAESVKLLRKALRLSQAEFARRTGTLDQSYVGKIEGGRNKATTVKVRGALAKGFGLTASDLDDYLEHRITLRDALQRIRMPEERPEPPPGSWAAAVIPPPPADLDKAISAAFSHPPHLIADAEAVRAAMRNYRGGDSVVGDLRPLVRRWLDVAAETRPDEQSGAAELTLETLLVRVTRDLETRINFLKLQLVDAGREPVELGWWDARNAGRFLNLSRDEQLAFLKSLAGLPATEVRDACHAFAREHPAFEIVATYDDDDPSS